MSTDSADMERRVRELLADVYTPEGVEIWLNAPNRSLGGFRAVDLLADGDGADVLAVAERLAGGAW